MGINLIACSEKQPRKKHRNYAWEKYFSEELKTPLLPNQAYLIVPQLVCKGCVQTTLYEIVHQIPDSLLSKVICIASDTSLFPPRFSNQVFQTIYDSTHYIDRLDISLKVNNVTLLYKRADSSKYVLTSNAKTHQSFVSQLQTFLGAH